MRRNSHKRARRSKPDPAFGLQLDVEIERIGKSGDGMAEHDGKRIYVPLALPGDRLSVRLKEKRGDGHVAERLDAKELMPRQQPACCHFGSCGGCRLQHLPAALYRDWKQEQIDQALKSRGFAASGEGGGETIQIRPLIDGEPETRRRLRLAFAEAGGRIILGHRWRERREIVAITECPIALPTITAFFQPLKQALARLDMVRSAGVKGGEVSITASDAGLDILIDTNHAPTLNDREELAALAEQEDFARISWRQDARSDAEPIAARREVIIHFGAVPVSLPPGVFLQATAKAEHAIIQAVRAAIHGAGRVADLFSGSGAIGLPLSAEGRKVQAFERDPAMVRTLNTAARASNLAGVIEAQSRDLDQDPLTPDELATFDALILDPPRAGARPQALTIAAAKSPPAIAMASCNPATFARDARILTDAGYRLAWVQPIDAFLYAAEIELVAAFNLAKTP